VPLLNVTLVPAPDQVVVRVTGDADLSTAPLIADALNRAAGFGTRQVVVDVAATLFWDCSGLHALSRFTARLSSAERSCRIVGAPARTRRLISAADLGDRLNLDGPAWTRAVTAPAEPPVPRPAVARTAVPARRGTSGHPVPIRSRRPLSALGLRRLSGA
jgi:anti-anti-sigma factor